MILRGTLQSLHDPFVKLSSDDKLYGYPVWILILILGVVKIFLSTTKCEWWDLTRNPRRSDTTAELVLPKRLVYGNATDRCNQSSAQSVIDTWFCELYGDAGFLGDSVLE